jgi:hypothetical protein
MEMFKNIINYVQSFWSKVDTTNQVEDKVNQVNQVETIKNTIRKMRNENHSCVRLAIVSDDAKGFAWCGNANCTNPSNLADDMIITTINIGNSTDVVVSQDPTNTLKYIWQSN